MSETKRCSHCGLLKTHHCFNVHITMCDDCWDQRKAPAPEPDGPDPLWHALTELRAQFRELRDRRIEALEKRVQSLEGKV